MTWWAWVLFGTALVAVDIWIAIRAAKGDELERRVAALEKRCAEEDRELARQVEREER